MNQLYSFIEAIEAMTTFKVSFGTPQKLVYEKRTSFMSADFSIFLLEFHITHAPRKITLPWTNGKVEIQNRHLSRHFRRYLSEARKNWAELACQHAFAHNTSVNSSTGATSYELVFGFESHVPNSLKIGLVQDDNDLHQSELCLSLIIRTWTKKQVIHA